MPRSRSGPGLDGLQSLAASALAALPPVGRQNPAPVVVPRPVRLRPATSPSPTTSPS
ncbi:MAG: hypothetical protein ACK501_14635 [Planctomycetota bacterium]